MKQVYVKFPDLHTETGMVYKDKNNVEYVMVDGVSYAGKLERNMFIIKSRNGMPVHYGFLIEREIVKKKRSLLDCMVLSFFIGVFVTVILSIFHVALHTTPLLTLFISIAITILSFMRLRR